MIFETTNPATQPTDVASFVARHQLFFNGSHWLSLYPSAHIRQCIIRNKNREVIGCFVYYLFKKASFTFLITPPFTPDAALFFVNPAESTVSRNSFSKELLAALADYLNSTRVSYLQLNLPASINDTQPFLWQGYSARSRYTYHLDLTLSEEQLWKNLSSEKRKSLNKAAKDQLEVRPSEDTDLIYELVIKSLSRNKKDKNLQVAKKIIAQYCGKANAISYVAYQGAKPVAATFCVIEQSRAMYLFGGYDAEHAHHGAGVSCMWSSILEAKKRGLRIFDFEGSMDRNIERYFREFGPELVSYQCIEKTKPLMKILLLLKGHHPL